MSKKANPTIIGAFVVGAIAIITVLILLLSSDFLFAEKTKVIMYFEGSVTGLNIGTPVKFRGVKIGTVTEIKLILDKDASVTKIPVIAEIDNNSYFIISRHKTTKASEIFTEDSYFIKQGLRATLKIASILTGQLYVELDFDPDSPYKLRGDGTIAEIPTQFTAIQEITKTLEKYPIQEVLNNIASTMVSLDKILSDPIIIETITSINQASLDYDLLAKKLTSNSEILSAELIETLRHANKTLESAQTTFINADKALIAAKQTINTSDNILREDSQLMFSLTDALTELANAARSVRDLADTLEQQPEAILRGKSGRR